MNFEGVRHRAMAEQDNKGRVHSPVLLHPGREGAKGGTASGWYGRKQQLNPIGIKSGCGLVWRMRSKERAERG